MRLSLIRSKRRCRLRNFLADLKNSSNSTTLASSPCPPHGLWALLLTIGLAAAATTSLNRPATGVHAAASHSHERASEYRTHQHHPRHHPLHQNQRHQAPEVVSTRVSSYPSDDIRAHPRSAQALDHDLATADQLLEPMTLEPSDTDERHNMIRAASSADDYRHHRHQGRNFNSDNTYHTTTSVDPEQANDDDGGGGEPAADTSQERDVFMNNHKSHLRAMRDMFERRQLNNNNNNNNIAGGHNLGQSSQELSPIAIGLDPGSPFGMPPFGVGGHEAGVSPRPHQMSANAEGGAAGPALPFGLNPLPHLLGFQGGPYDGPQRGDQPAYTNHHAASSAATQDRGAGGGGGGDVDPELAAPAQKVWPKIFRFTDGRINLSDFEKQKKVRLSSKNQHGENHIESAPIMFDGRQLKRKSFLILHGGVFQGNRRR